MPAVCQSGNLNRTLIVKQNWIAASKNAERWRWLPSCGARQLIPLAKNINRNPSLRSAAMSLDQFVILAVGGVDLLLHATYDTGVTRLIPQAICATKPPECKQRSRVRMAQMSPSPSPDRACYDEGQIGADCSFILTRPTMIAYHQRRSLTRLLRGLAFNI